MRLSGFHGVEVDSGLQSVFLVSLVENGYGVRY